MTSPSALSEPLDRAEPVAPGPRDPRLDAWRTFVQAHARLFRRLDDELRTAHGLSLAEYDALVQLAAAVDRRLRMSQLADQVLLSKSGITRMVDRLVAAGLVERIQCSHDARGAEAVLTESGLDRLRTAARTHIEGVDRYFLSALSGAELAVIERTMTAVGRRIGEDSEAADACDPDDAAPA
jgi:DNA-binding MarR family transcriptional regulator